MSFSMIACLVIFVVMIVLFFTRWIPMSFTCMGVLVALVLCKCIDAKTALAGFSNSAVITMGGMFIVSAGLMRTQLINKLARLLYKVSGGSFTIVLAAYGLITMLLGQFVPSLTALFAMVCPLVVGMCDEMDVNPTKMLFPIAIIVVSCSFVIEPIGPYAAWFLTQNSMLQSYGWTGPVLNNWSETIIFLPTAILTFLFAVLVVPRLLPENPDVPVGEIEKITFDSTEPLSPVKEVLGYVIFAITIIGLLTPKYPAWVVTTFGATLMVATGILSEKEAIKNLNMGTILLYVGVLVLGQALGKTGAAEWIGDVVVKMLGGCKSGWVIYFVCYMISYLMTSLLYNRAVTMTFIPVICIMCVSIGCDPRGAVILCSLASMSSLITPLSTSVVPMVMKAGGYSQKTILKAGIGSGILRGIVGTTIAVLLFHPFG